MDVIFAGTSDIRSDQVPQVGLGPFEEAAPVVDEFGSCQVVLGYVSQARAQAPQRADAVGDLGRRRRRLARCLVVGLEDC
ncbi:hypothetical protein [Streptomyces sp. NPDC004533]|uniref:hypothetical protein n=1 Tax=Streptomyces sp. NPDC004533 TaxID=3154278 RepID=UPI0033A69FC1